MGSMDLSGRGTRLLEEYAAGTLLDYAIVVRRSLAGI